jgi:hypothetical protein
VNQDFAKMFRHPEIGQILVQRDYDHEDERPILNMTFWFEKAGGRATVTLGYENSDDGVEKRDKSFDSFNEEKAIEQVNKFIRAGEGNE